MEIEMKGEEDEKRMEIDVVQEEEKEEIKVEGLEDPVAQTENEFVKEWGMKVLGFEVEMEFERFLKKACAPVLRTIGLMHEIAAGKWVNYGEPLKLVHMIFVQDREYFTLYDYSLLSVLFASRTFSDDFLESVLEGFSQNDTWI